MPCLFPYIKIHVTFWGFERRHLATHRSLNFLMFHGTLNPDKSSTFNVRYSISTLPSKSATSPNQCARGGDGIKRARYIDDVRHILNVVSLPCRMWIDNPQRLASQCEFLMSFIRQCVLQVTVYQTTHHFLAIHQQTANSMTRCRLWFANSICVWPGVHSTKGGTCVVVREMPLVSSECNSQPADDPITAWTSVSGLGYHSQVARKLFTPQGRPRIPTTREVI